MFPVGPVANWKIKVVAFWRAIVCTPSENEKAMGDTVVNGMFAASGPANVNIPDTNMLVV
jgi:hypothetical protein